LKELKAKADTLQSRKNQ
jgi:DNA repair protein RAD50